MRRILFFVVLVCFGSSAMAETPTEAQKIHYLLDQLTTSDITFIRNGESHDGKWAKDHLQKKWKKAGKPSLTAEQFITDIASTSSQTNKPYMIKTKDGATVEAASWFKQKLAAMPAR